MVSLRPACFLALGTTLGERVYAIQEEEGRPEEQHLQHWFALKQKSTPPPSGRLMQLQ
jgi:hypothetical protein